MAKPLSMDLRERLLAAVEFGLSCHAAAERFAVSASCVIKLMQQHRTEGTIAPGKFGRHMRPVLEPHYARIGELAAATPDITIDELQERLAGEGIVTSRLPLGRCLLALKLRKKDEACPRTVAAGRGVVRAARREGQPNLTASRLVFIDETWASTAMTRLYGRAANG